MGNQVGPALAATYMACLKMAETILYIQCPFLTVPEHCEGCTIYQRKAETVIFPLIYVPMVKIKYEYAF